MERLELSLRDRLAVVSHTNYIDITVRMNRDQLIVLAALDNLIKGASGVAVQNFNLLAGFDETTALIV